MNAPLLRLRKAALGYNATPVLSGVELSVEPGAFLGILGPNGSGKTTLLKTLLGLIPRLAGELERAPGLRFGYVPQKEKLDPVYPLSAFDVAALGAGRDRAAVERSLAECGATELARTRFSELSGGQRQRVLIARAIATNPTVLALDEPLAGIDAATQPIFIALLQRLRKEHSLTVLMVSHRISVEKGLFTHIAWCERGAAAVGPAAEMLKHGPLSETFKAQL